MNIKKIVSTFLSVCMAAGTFTSAISETANAEYARVSVHDPSVVKSEDGSYYTLSCLRCFSAVCPLQEDDRTPQAPYPSDR